MKVEELDGASVRAILEREARGVLVDFWSPWCAPCRALRPHLARLAQERSAEWRFVAINTEKHPASVEEFGISSLPTLVWFRKGTEIKRLTGGVTLSSIAAALDELH